MKVDFTKVKTMDIDGKPIEYEEGDGLFKFVANTLYRLTEDVDWVNIALEISKGKPVELTKKQIMEIRSLVTLKNGFFTFARKAIFDYLDKVEEADKKKEKK